ncbi:5'/3'-nucleotidase SurE [Nannocystis pusilla]|uniref:5'/3'-nucleotidase SurE n=1 Tax=Nannocystis pusilla TaxID=889268 RepID=UPI003B7B0FD9
MSERPLILVTNDDGILAPGILALAEAVAPLGDVVVCAPETERSGSSHAITLHSHLRVDEVRPGWHRVNGTPVDCVYLASLHLCERRPALVVSGVNPGYNLGSDVFYSGTVGGAAEGFIRGASAMAVSVHARESPRVAIPVVRTLARMLLAQPSLSLLNVNIPWISHSAPPPEGRRRCWPRGCRSSSPGWARGPTSSRSSAARTRAGWPTSGSAGRRATPASTRARTRGRSNAASCR